MFFIVVEMLAAACHYCYRHESCLLINHCKQLSICDDAWALYTNACFLIKRHKFVWIAVFVTTTIYTAWMYKSPFQVVHILTWMQLICLVLIFFHSNRFTLFCIENIETNWNKNDDENSTADVCIWKL